MNSPSENEEKGTTDEQAAAAQSQRRSIIEGRLHRPLGPATPATELENLRTNTATTPSFLISYECRRSNAAASLDRILGKGCAPYPESMTLLELKESIIKSVNPRWTEAHSADLQPSETELRVRGNVALPPEDEVLSMRHWFNKYNTPQMKSVYLVPVTGMGKGFRGSSFSLELFIHVDRFLARTGEDNDDGSDSDILGSIGNAGTKRKRGSRRVSNTKAKAGSQGGKRARHNGENVMLRSTFARDNGSASVMNGEQSKKIKFKRIVCTINSEDGTPTIIESSSVEEALLGVISITLSAGDRGKTKDVFSLLIDNKPYVAKKLIDVGRGREDVTLEESLQFLTADLIRLKRMEYFASLFIKRAEQEGAEIANFQISEGFLIKICDETDPKQATADPTVDPTAENDEDEFDEPLANEARDKLRGVSAVYLVEPRRLSSAVTKYSGTLGMRNRIDKQYATIMAFSHFVIESSACEYMFADIQGSLDRNHAQNESVMTLFDPMTHTPLGQSGLGDFGLKGFQNFVTAHECTNICRALQLCSKSVIQGQLDLMEE
ncbi:kinase-like domain-containing protein [Hygrophoropsis aurantiaca]|uniref:Kinase-like domain-containing protein n=1 Tax=Hygrophoropsis aurantiaca TaxID=72124 RepID=A0ACB7ZTJ0_9AGAM|nr:kinase-like domain-containing protein [Hygrophoropsis aurantiaca]